MSDYRFKEGVGCNVADFFTFEVNSPAVSQAFSEFSFCPQGIPQLSELSGVKKDITLNRSLEESMEATGAELFLQAVLEEGAEVAFGIPGTHILPIIELLGETRGLKFVNVRHEAGATAMADAYGRLTGKPGLCLVTAGPGATNSLTGVAHAFSAASPLVHVSGTVPVGSGLGAFHGADDPNFLEKVFAPVTKKSCSVRSVSDIPPTIHQCFLTASTARRGPVHLSLPLNLLVASGRGRAKPHVIKIRPRASPSLTRARKIVASSEKPILLVGEEARGLRREVEALAEKIRAPVLSTMNALGVFPQTSALFVGYIEQFWRVHPAALSLLQDGDLVISIGARANTPEVKCVAAIARRNWLFVAEESAGKNEAKGTTLTGDIRSNLVALTSLLQPVERRDWAGRAFSQMKSYLREPEEIASRNAETRPIHPALAVQGIYPHLSGGSVVCADSGGNEVWVREYLAVRIDCDYLYSGTFGGMGFALPAAIAASIVRPEMRIVTVAGDGGLLMSLMELSTLAEQKSNAVVVVLNDSAYGMMWLLEHHKTACLLNPVNFAKVAEGFGIRSWRVEEPSQLKDSYAEAFSATGPALVDVVVDYKQPFPYESIMKGFRRKYPEN